MSDDRNPDGTYISSPYSSAEQSAAGVSYSDSYFSAKNKVEAKFQSDLYEKNRAESLLNSSSNSGQSESFGTGGSSNWFVILLAICAAVYFLHVLWVKFEHAVNEACIFSVAFDQSACRHKKITSGRLPVRSEDEVRLTAKWLESLNKDDKSFLTYFTSACSRVIGSGAEYCRFVEAIGQEIKLIPEKSKYSSQDIRIEMRPLVDNSIRYYKSVGDVSSSNQLQVWAASLKAAEDKIMNARIGKWRSTRCTDLSGKDTKECAQFKGMSMEFKHNSTITALPNGMVQEKSFDPNKVTVVGGDIIKYPSGSSLKVESASKVIFEWRGHLFHLERIS